MINVNPKQLKQIFTTYDSIDRNGYVIVRYRVVPGEGLTLEQAAAHIALLVSVGTIGRLPYESQDRLRFSGYVLEADRRTGQVHVAVPVAICGVNEGLAQLLGVISFAAEYRYTKEFWIEDIDLPPSLLQSFPGPRFGVSGFRRYVHIPERPLIGVIPKPRFGVNLAEIAAKCKEALLGGADFISDDELIVDPPGELGFERRVPELVRTARDASDETGEPKWYVANVGASPRRTIEYALRAKELGASALLVNGFTMGISTIEDLRREELIKLPIFSSNLGSAILTRSNLTPEGGRSTGVSEAVIAKLSRLAGADAVHIGSTSSEWYGGEAWGDPILMLQRQLGNIEHAFAVAAGGVIASSVWDNMLSIGKDVMIEAGSGLLGYPGGPREVARVFRALANSLDPDIVTPEEAHSTIEAMSMKDRRLREVLDHYGYKWNQDSK